MTRKILNSGCLLPVYIMLILVMFILPYYSLEGYSILQNTTSQLGAQNTPNAWIMNFVFFLLGIFIIKEGWFRLKRYWIQKILLTVFGLGLINVAIFNHAPISEGITYNFFEDTMHSVFANIIGIFLPFLLFPQLL